MSTNSQTDDIQAIKKILARQLENGVDEVRRVEAYLLAKSM